LDIVAGTNFVADLSRGILLT